MIYKRCSPQHLSVNDFLLIITFSAMLAKDSVNADKNSEKNVRKAREYSEHCIMDNLSLVPQDIARYDHYRVYSVELDTDKHVDLFQKLEQQSDSLTFMGHAREVGQKLTLLVAAHKVADFANLLQTFNVKHRILVCIHKIIIMQMHTYVVSI
uniref:Zinc carboxypeptidase A 1 n=1 Tax=Bactrocera latifrons TaxID=174628 RepID=A0A0K8URM8_BACLA